MADESCKRVQDYLKFGCNAFDAKRPISRPLGFWTEEDVLYYLLKKQIPYAPIYGDIIWDYKKERLKTTGVDRTGCVPCMFGCHLEKDENKFQKLKKTHPKFHNYCISYLGCGEVLDYIKVSY
jgi:3'-phosphoadenosine 5'-phosphosulfate sulfotransferase (PAPS reductase)/FAD synthetase